MCVDCLAIPRKDRLQIKSMVKRERERVVMEVRLR